MNCRGALSNYVIDPSNRTHAATPTPRIVREHAEFVGVGSRQQSASKICFHDRSILDVVYSLLWDMVYPEAFPIYFADTPVSAQLNSIM